MPFTIDTSQPKLSGKEISFGRKLKLAATLDLEYWEVRMQKPNLSRNDFSRLIASAKSHTHSIKANFMDSCIHEFIVKKNIKTEFLGKKFAYKGEVCKLCESVLWTDATQKAFSSWLFRLHEKEPNLFVMQPRLSEAALKYLDKINAIFKDHSRATIIRALVYVFIDDLNQDPHFAKKTSSVKNTEAYEYFFKGDKRPIRVRVKPSQYLDLLTWSKVTGDAPAKVVEGAVLGFLSMFRENELQKGNQDLDQMTEMIHDMLKAA